MPTLKRPNMGDICVCDGHAGGAQFGNDALHLQGVPQNHDVRQQAETGRLVHDCFVVVGAELALVGEEQPACQGMTGLSAVQLGLDQSAEWRVVKVAQDVACLDQPAERGQRLGYAVAGAAGGETLQYDVGWCSSGLEGSCDADELVPLLCEDGRVDGPGKQRRERIGNRHVHGQPQTLVGQILEAGHEVDPEQMAQAPQGFGEAVGIGGVQAGGEAGVVVEQAVENVGRLPRGTGDHLGGEDRDPVTDVSVNGYGFVVVAEVSGMVGADEGARWCSESLPVRGGEPPVAPEPGELHPMEMFDDLGIGRLQGDFADHPAGSLLEIGGGQVLDAVAHCGQAKIGAVRNQGGEQGAIGIRSAWFIAGQRPEGAGEAATPVDVEQNVFDPHSGHPAFDFTAQMADLGRHGQGIGPIQAKLALVEASEIVGSQAGGKGEGSLFDVVRQAREVVCRPLGQAEVGVGHAAGRCPHALVEDQCPETGMPATTGQMQIAGAERIANRQSERGFPHRAAQQATVVPQHLPPASRNEVGRRVFRQGLDLTTIKLADQVDRPQHVALPGVGRKRQRQEGWQGLAQIRVAGKDGVDHTTAILGSDGPAGGDRALQSIGPQARAQTGHGFHMVASEYGLAGVDQREQSVFSLAAQTLGLRLGSVAGTAHQAGHVGVVGLNHVIEQPLAAVEQEADQQAVALVGRKVPQGIAIVTSAQLSELPADSLGHIREIGQIGQHDRDLLQLLMSLTAEASHRGCRWHAVATECGPSLGIGFAGQSTNQPVEGFAHG